MADAHSGDVTEMDPWQVFETRLRAYVSTMIDPSDEDRLVLHVPTSRVEDGETVVRIGLADGATALTVDYAFDGTGSGVDQVDDFAWRVCETIRFRFDPPHPELMTVEVDGPAAGGVGVLGLALHDSLDEADGEDEAESLGWPTSQEELRDMVIAHLRHEHGMHLELDEDGDVPLLVDGVGLWVRAESDAPMIHLFTRVVDDVWSRRQSGVELNVLNRDHRWSRWVRRERSIWQELHVPAHPFVPRTLDAMIEGFVSDSQQTRADLADRLGGKALG